MSPNAQAATVPRAPRPRLTRPRSCLATGVSAGLAATSAGRSARAPRVHRTHAALRHGDAALSLALGVPPVDPATGDAEADTITRRAPVAWGLVAASAIAAGAAIVLSPYDYYDAWSVDRVLAPILAAIVLAVSASSWATFVDRTDPERGRRTERLVRAAATIVLGVLFIAVFLGPLSTWRSLYVLLVGFALLLGIALVFAPVLLRLWRELGAERTRRIREEQRSEIAAHLHDSVLQTLALIQNRAGASSEVARIARAQERELRAWLFDGDAPADSDLATDLRDYGRGARARLPGADRRRRRRGVRASVRAARSPPRRREAMLNAATARRGRGVGLHRGRPRDAVEVFVRDRGPGFALADVPRDRLGVRESIIGRMRRAGGSARPCAPASAGSGTEVHLHLAREEARVPIVPAKPPDPARVSRRQGAPAIVAESVRVVIVDDHSIFRRGSRPTSTRRIEVVGEAHDVESAVAVIAGRQRPTSCCSTCTCRAAAAVRRRRCAAEVRGDPPAASAAPGTRFLALSVSDSAEDVVGVIRAGARGYITKGSPVST